MSSSVPRRFFDIRKRIHTNALQVNTNKIQCEHLVARIDQLIEPLERLEHASSSYLRQETRPLVEEFLNCLDDCNNFIEKLKSSVEWWQEIPEHEYESHKFEELNKRLSQFGDDLSLGLNIQQLFDRKQDEEDKKQDMQNLTRQINQIFHQQQDQYKLIDKMIQQRFESFSNHLTQNSTIPQDRIVPTERDHFLHIPYNELYIEEKPIGTGGFADVYKGVWLTHHDQVAIKVLRHHNLSSNSQSNVRDDFYQEISIMHRIRYEHILTVLGICIELDFYAIIVEYMPLGSLYDILHGETEITFSWSDRYSLACQMSKSINYLHNLDPYILHRDIKSKNFLIKRDESSDHRFLLKVCDFGLAENRRSSLLQSSTSSQIVGSLVWKAPELLTSHERHTKQSDVYSLGITMWELASGKKPWDDYEDDSVIIALVKAGERPDIPFNVPETYKQAIEDAWNHNPLERPTCFDLMKRMRQQMKENRTTGCFQTLNLTSDTDSTKTSLPVMDDVNDKSKRQKPTSTTTEIGLKIALEHSTSCSSQINDDQQKQKSIEDSAILAKRRLSRRSLIAKIITPSINEKRRQSIVKRDDDSEITETRF